MHSEAAIYAFYVPVLVQLPSYISEEWHDRVRIVYDDKGLHFIWTGWSNGAGHGKVSINGKAKYVHREVVERVLGRELAKDEIVDHLCRHRGCIHDHHLEPVTMKVNTDRGLGVHHQFKKRQEYGEAEVSRSADAGVSLEA